MLCVGGSELARVSSRLQAGRQPCVRPVSAVHDAAGNKTIRSRLSARIRRRTGSCGLPWLHTRRVADAISIPHDGTVGYPTDGCSPLFGAEE